MSTPDTAPSDEAGLRAAEYVLGTLGRAEREAYRQERAGSPSLQAAERAWEARLAPLAAAVPGIAPPAGAWDRIAARLPAEAPGISTRVSDRPAAPVVDLRPALRRWRRAAVAAGSLAAGLALFIAVERLAPRAEPAQYLAVVNRGGELPALVVRVDTRAGTVQVRALAAEAPRDRSLELWVVPASGVPRSLGLVRDAADTRLALPAGDRPLLDGASLAVTVEPPGGSPSGAPTGPAIYSGRLITD
ncbi:Anti-sigma-K factor RskA [Methylobacterium sp. ap11]|uniref:anti-sigma factor n=1 Tax=Methylobacterium sp. ap11 TaxID=1761799 RepID=UPI0008B34FDE|nr:anti-sigma factor [Methylobacterium sp. ap11]SEP42763.1 Anti-sigma-K factor RskA [Methylobacterium sp. ap11]